MGQVTRYSESEQAWNKSEQNRITELQLARGFQVADIYLNRAYLDVFSAAPIISLNRSEMDISKLRLFEISKLVFDAEEKFTDKLMSVYSALHSMESSIAMLIDSDGEKIQFYIGTRSEKNPAIAGDILESTLKGNFPGIVYETKSMNDIQNLITEIQMQKSKSLSNEQTKELSRLNVGVAAVFQKGWLSPVLMKVDKWDNRYNTQVEMTNTVDLRVTRGELLNALYEQKNEEKFSPMRLRTITRSSVVPIDKKRELDEVLRSYNERFPVNHPFDRYYYGNLLIELMGCEQLFKVIPLSGIPTYKEFDEVDENTREFSEMLYAYKKGTESWFKKFFDAFSFYIASDDEKAKADGILSMLYVVGHEGKIKYYRDDRLAMLCRMLYRQLGILL